MGGLRCGFCGKDYVQSCRDAAEAARCGNLSNEALANLKKLGAELSKVERLRRGPTKAEIEKRERAELARLKKKYERK